MPGVDRIEDKQCASYPGKGAFRKAILAGFTAVMLLAPAARAQDATTSPASAQTTGEAPAAPAVEPSAPADTPISPTAGAIADDAVPATSTPTSADDGNAETDNPTVEGGAPAPAPDNAPPADAEAGAAQSSQTAPSLLEDPAGALTNMLAPAERDPNLPHNLSPWGMFLGADWVVKAVMLGLAFASLVTWTVWIAKSLELMGAKARVRRALKAIGSADTLEQASNALARRTDPASRLVHAAEHEVRRSADALDRGGGQGLLQRVTSHLSRIEMQAGRSMSRGTGVLATIGSTAPFVGLFGTVWGIMRSFIGISEAQTTNLAVVAPGIAEALLATALGLVAAIPAVVIYNYFARGITGYRQLLGDMSAAVERQVSRDLDHGVLSKPLTGLTALTQAAQ